MKNRQSTAKETPKEKKLDHTERYHPRRSEAGIGGNALPS